MVTDPLDNDEMLAVVDGLIESTGRPREEVEAALRETIASFTGTLYATFGVTPEEAPP